MAQLSVDAQCALEEADGIAEFEKPRHVVQSHSNLSVASIVDQWYDRPIYNH